MSDVCADLDDDDELVELKVALPNHALACSESLWGDALDDGQFVLRCIPKFAYGLSWGDVVHAAPAKDDTGALTIDRVVRHSEHETVRLTFLRRTLPRDRGPLLDKLRDFGLSYEGSPMQTIAIDVPPAADYRALVSQLRQWADDGLLHFETCEERAEGSFDDAPAAEAAAAMQAMMTAAASSRQARSRGFR